MFATEVTSRLRARYCRPSGPRSRRRTDPVSRSEPNGVRFRRGPPCRTPKDEQNVGQDVSSATIAADGCSQLRFCFHSGCDSSSPPSEATRRATQRDARSAGQAIPSGGMHHAPRHAPPSGRSRGSASSPEGGAEAHGGAERAIRVAADRARRNAGRSTERDHPWKPTAVRRHAAHKTNTAEPNARSACQRIALGGTRHAPWNATTPGSRPRCAAPRRTRRTPRSRTRDPRASGSR